MSNQWTTVTDNAKKASHDAGNIMSLSQVDSRKNRRIALALASTGVFLILVGAAPFVFNGGDSSNYSAFLGQDPDLLGVNAVPEDGAQIPMDDFGDDVLNLGSEPVDVNLDDVGAISTESDSPDLPAPPGNPPSMGEATTTPEPVMTPLPTAEEPTPFPTLIETPIAETPIEETPVYSAAPEYEDDFRDEIPAGNDEIITEAVDFPVNIHVDGSAEPVDYSVVVGEEFHMAAPHQPKSGAPLLPLLAFSGSAAAWFRARRKKHA